MTKQEGIAKLRNLLGPKAGWRDASVHTSDEHRVNNRTVREDVRHKYEGLRAQRDEMKRRLLDVPEYQALIQATKDAESEYERWKWNAHDYRLTVGIDTAWGFEVKAKGDNWADVIRKLETALSMKEMP